MMAWHVSVITTAALILSELAVYLAADRLRGMTAHRMAGVLTLVALVSLAGTGVYFFGMAAMDQLASVASAIMAAVAIRLTYQSYRAAQASPTGQPSPSAQPSRTGLPSRTGQPSREGGEPPAEP
ncbi:hypothetical protein [Actinoplanes sp. NPDC051494]|uniref:hypothetical protein n=1 Tax=Actinoplanes sp. NPDC051494 TaxID=3363907 RepID=UPI00379BC02C